MSIFIAEVKTESPFGFKSSKTWDDLYQTAVLAGDMVSIHVDTAWGGHPSLIDRAYERMPYPKQILAKGLTDSVARAKELIARGADYVLVTDQHVQEYFAPGICWLELPPVDHDLPRLKPEHTYVVNARNPYNGSILSNAYVESRWRHVRRLHWGKLIQASCIQSRSDVFESADGFIVGQHLDKFVAHRDDPLSVRKG